VCKRFVVVYEAPADFATATELADRELAAACRLNDVQQLETLRPWAGEEFVRNASDVVGDSRSARSTGLRVHGHFDGQPGLPDAKAARCAIAYVLRTLDPVAAIVLVRDADHQTERRQGLEQARRELPSLPIAIGLAVPCGKHGPLRI